jgi:hypothetical protein
LGPISGDIRTALHALCSHAIHILIKRPIEYLKMNNSKEDNSLRNIQRWRPPPSLWTKMITPLLALHQMSEEESSAEQWSCLVHVIDQVLDIVEDGDASLLLERAARRNE